MKSEANSKTTPFHKPHIQRTLELANAARLKGDHPFGALLAYGEDVLLEDVNTVNSDRDVTRHAELNLISHASRTLSSDVLGKATLYCSSEPCVMCTGAIYWSGIRKIVYGCPAATLKSITRESFLKDCRDILGDSQLLFEIHQSGCEDRAAEIHRKFWDIVDSCSKEN